MITSTELALESMKDELSSGTKAQLDCSSYLPSAKSIAGLLLQFVKLGFSCLPSEVQPVVRRLAGDEEEMRKRMERIKRFEEL